MSATVLVVGGTGALGAPTAQRLREDGYKVRLLVRDPERLPHRPDDVEYVRGDLEDPDTLRSALLGCEAVHVSVRGGPTAEQFDRIEHHGTARLAQLAAQAGANLLTFVSHSLAAPDAPPADLRAKFHAEEAIVASGVPYTIFRPTYFMDTLPRHLRGQRALVLGRQPHALHMVAAADFTRLVSRSLAVPETAGRCLDVHGPEAITIPDALRTYCDQLAPDTRVVSMPLWFMKIVDRTLLKRQLRRHPRAHAGTSTTRRTRRSPPDEPTPGTSWHHTQRMAPNPTTALRLPTRDLSDDQADPVRSTAGGSRYWSSLIGVARKPEPRLLLH